MGPFPRPHPNYCKCICPEGRSTKGNFVEVSEISDTILEILSFKKLKVFETFGEHCLQHRKDRVPFWCMFY